MSTVQALIVDPRDNVATAIADLSAGTVVETNRGDYHVAADVNAGHKFALRPLPAGESVVKYGSSVGVVSAAIDEGDHVHVHNTASIVPSERQRSDVADLSALRQEPYRGSWDVEALRAIEFDGFARADGSVGVRNTVLIISTVGCANVVADRIARETDTVAITHQQGCLQLGTDTELTRKQLLNVAHNPNIGAVLFVGLGCETMQAAPLAQAVTGRTVKAIGIQGEGGTRKTVERGVAIIKEMQDELARQPRTRASISKLVVGTKCGGSDAFSGLTANPACGVASDMFVDAGAAVLLSETPGLFGSEPFLAARMENMDDRRRLAGALDRVWDESVRLGELMSEGEMSPGNIAGGLTTLVEKSLGATTKAGTRPFSGFIEFADRVPGPGLWLMDTPGFDIITISGQAAGGAQLLLFTTGRGSPVGSSISPVVKVCSNSRTYEWMDEDMDVDAGAIISRSVPLEQLGREIFDRILASANGLETNSELGGHHEFALARIGSTL
jgi:altronate dehydratase